MGIPSTVSQTLPQESSPRAEEAETPFIQRGGRGLRLRLWDTREATLRPRPRDTTSVAKDSRGSASRRIPRLKNMEVDMRKSFCALVLATALFALLGGAAGADTSRQSQLTPLSGSGSGFVEVSPTSKDEAGLTFDVQGTVNIHGATPNADFTVLRRVDLNPNGICSGAIWLTLPGN